MELTLAIVVFTIAALFLTLLLIRLHNIGSMKRLWPLAATVAVWLLFGLWQITLLLGHTLPPTFPNVWPVVLLPLSFLSLDRV
jgi:hypothetical protein